MKYAKYFNRKRDTVGHVFQKRPGMERAVEVAEGTQHAVEEIRSSSQSRTLSALRKEAMSRMYEAGYNPTEIGKWFNRTPSAVIHAHERA